MPDDLAIALSDVRKTFRGKVHALRGASLSIHRGEIFGLLGPNGAGKSTLVKILMTVIRASHCAGHMLGRPIGDKSALARVGYLPEHHRFPEYLTARQVLHHFAALSGLSARQRRARAGELLDLVGLTAWSDRRVRQFSKGMRQRLGLAQALMHDPELVLLDEPTDGVDPVGRRDIREVLVRQRAAGRTILVNSHLLSELEIVCDRCAIMVQGQVAQQGTLDELTAYGRGYEIEAARLAESLPPETLAAGTLDASGEKLWLPGVDAAGVQPIIDRLRQAGRAVRAVRPVRPSLEDLFMRAITDDTTGRLKPLGAAEAGATGPARGDAAAQAAPPSGGPSGPAEARA